jgi:DNA recombination protein RmuC
VRKLQTHFGQSAKDIDDILVSTSKVTKRGQKIEALEFGVAGDDAAGEDAPAKRVADSKTGQLRLRVVDGDD